MEDIAREYITYARQFVSNNSYTKAFDLYIMAFEKCPGMKNHHESEFRDMLNKLNEILCANRKMDDIFKNFERALKLFPNNMLMLNEIGKYLYKFGLYKEAWSHFEKALKLDSGFVKAEKNLNLVKTVLVPRWHYRMLNDKVSNFAYHDAISKTIKPFKDSVLDIGSGTCILSIYANEFCPTTIAAVDSSEVMAHLSEDITRHNGMSDVFILNKICVGSNYCDIGGKRSLVVTEMFDAGLFSEHILESILYAWEHLVSNVGRILPRKADFFVVPVDSNSLNMKYQLSSSAKVLLNIPDVNVHTLTRDKPYDSQDIHNLKDLKYLAEPHLLVKVDFNDIKDLQEKLARTKPYKAEFKITENGELNNVVGWFSLNLYDDISITTDPRSVNRATAWQQAVFYDNIPRDVAQDQTVSIDFFLNESKLTMSSDSDAEILRISTEALRFLNDRDYINNITGCIGMASVYLGQIAEMSEINVVDMCPFPVFGLIMLMRGANSLVCYAKELCDKVFIEKILQVNNISKSRVTILVGDDWKVDVFGEEKFHAVFCNILEVSGDINLRYKEIAQTLKEGHLMQGGLFMPKDIKVVAQLVSSRWLDINNIVYDENIGNYDVAKHLNKFQVSQNFCIDLNRLEYTAITDPVVFGSYNSELRSQVANVPIVNAGMANAILCWYNIELMEEMKELSTNRLNAYIDGSVFMLNKKLPLLRGNVTNLLRCVDPDGSFKIVMDGGTT